MDETATVLNEQIDTSVVRRSRRWMSPWVVVDLVLLAAIMLGGTFGGYIPAFYLYVASLGGLYALLAIGNNLLLAHAGIVSLGQGALFAIGAYAAAVADIRGWGLLPSLVLGVVCAVVASFLIGLPSLRLRGHYFALVTLTLSLAINELITIWPNVTGGSAGLSVVDGTLAPIPLFFVICLLVCIALVSQDRLIRSRLGVTLRLVRDSEVAARACGVSVPRYKLLAFIYSGALAGLAGALFPSLTNYVAPSSFDLWISIYILAAVILGGMYSPVGALLGGAFVAVLPQLVNQYQGLTTMIFGVALLAVILVSERRSALTGLVRRLRPGARGTS